MAPDMQNPAGQGGACEDTQCERVIQQDTATGPKLQDNVVGTISKNQRDYIRVSLRTFSDLRQIDVRTYKNLNGIETGTKQGLPIRPCNLDALIELLQLAKIAAKAEGLIP
jgi:hypothetical protein